MTDAESVANRFADAYAAHRQGRLAAAWSAYRALALEAPFSGEIRRLMAILLFQTGDRSQSARLARQAICLSPGDLPPMVLLLSAVEGDESATFRLAARCLRLDPVHPDVGMVMVDALLRAGRAEAAETATRRLLTGDPAHRRALRRAGEIARSRGRFADAAVWLRRTAALEPGDIGLMFQLGTARERAGLDALAAYRACVAHDPTCVEALFNLANGAAAAGRAGNAILLAKAAARTRWSFVPAVAGLAAAFYGEGRIDEAAAAFRQALAVDPCRIEALLNYANLLKGQGDVEGALKLLERLLTAEPRHAAGFSNLLFTLCFRQNVTGEELRARHREFDRRFAQPLAPPPRVWPNSRDPERRLRLGFLSPNFRRHPGGSFLLPFVTHVDRQAFEIYCYYSGSYEDDLTRRFRAAADGWRFCQHDDDAALTARIRADQIDILVDCAGHLAESRLLTFARRPAPVQVSFPIYPATTGLSAMDYRIMDPYFAPPPPGGDLMHAETVIRLPDCHVCYRPLDTTVEPAAEPPMLRAGCVTLASFNNFAKTGDDAVALWAETMRRIPNSRLLLKWRGLQDGALARRRLQPFVAAGVALERIRLLDWSPDPYTPYLDVDFCLDPPHANGGTTTCDALWMGVPVVTRVGPTPFARVGLCHLTNVGLTELIAYDDEAYVDIAVRLAADPERLTALRRGLRQRFAASPLMDAPRYARGLEQAFRGVWRAWCSGAGTPNVAADDGRAVDAFVAAGYRHHNEKNYDKAAALYRAALVRIPAHFDALHLLGVAARQQGDGPAAARRIKQALRLLPSTAPAWFNLGQAQRECGRPDLAAAAQRAAVALQPDSGGAYTALGTSLQAHLRTAEAEAVWRRALLLDDGDASAHVNLAWAMLIRGRYAEGWPEFEWRWRRDDFTSPLRPFSQPQWRGEPLDGKTLLLHAEQGFGDTIQMLRYAPLAAARGGRVVLEAPAVLEPLTRNLPGLAQFIPQGAPLPDFDLHCPLMSLPLAFGTTVDAIPAPPAYLAAEPSRAAAWRRRMNERAPEADGALKVGLLWAGSPIFKGDRDRSPRLAPLTPLLSVAGARFFGIQMGDGRRDMEGVDLPPHFIDFGGDIVDFGDSAAIMANLDLMITSCSAPAHLAGALGVPTWLLLSYAPDWRWLLGRRDTPWYPSMRLFRQPSRGDWASVAAEAVDELRRLTAGRRSCASS